MMMLYRYVYKSSITGRFVSKDHAKLNPHLTYRQRVWFWQKAEEPAPVPGMYE